MKSLVLSLSRLMGEFNLADSEEWFLEWSEMLERVVPIIKDLEQTLSQDCMMPVFNALLHVIYLNYMGGIGFMQQFRKNADEAEQMLSRLREIVTTAK